MLAPIIERIQKKATDWGDLKTFQMFCFFQKDGVSAVGVVPKGLIHYFSRKECVEFKLGQEEAAIEELHKKGYRLFLDGERIRWSQVSSLSKATELLGK